MSVEFRDELGKVLFYDTFHGFVSFYQRTLLRKSSNP